MTASEERLAALTSWHADWSGLRVVVYGLGVTGFSVADTLAELGASVLVVASRADHERAMLLDVIGAELLLQADLSAPPERLTAFGPELIVVSPGFHADHPLLLWADQQGIPVWGDIELAWRLRDKTAPPGSGNSPADWICVTGTNGKTTTVQLTATMLLAGGSRVAPCGNIGVAVLDAIRDPQGFDVLVVELSSYQLHWINRNAGGEVSPYAAACLNIADDHLDWHGSLEAYAAAKAKVYENAQVACVYNRADEATLRMVEETEVVEGARAIGFGLDVPGPSDFGIVDGILCDRAFLDDRLHSAIELTTLEELREAGLAAPHIVANILAASALARAYGVEPWVVRDVLSAFRLDAHRIELVRIEAGVSWVDDSKATNPHAADASLRAYPSVVWVVGGLFKGVDLDGLVKRHAARLRGAVLIGADRDLLRSAFQRHAPGLPVVEVDADETEHVMPTAVRLAAALVRDGDTVLLAPAAASMDQFSDYAERGRLFQAAVNEYLGGGADDGSSASRPGSGG
ncbi:UDP-N-acetylmuramoylalanine--D-glutamate ligase [Leifsonia xyli subsp. xyli]|uniref:UDP-N-acetylmuramoylalanine--D-glutamate ligase n=2 Tax=Leifsonia xyli subsp. xyli TaxID=59736 RepID=MURD_LEIXX|nr:UDP-N-acetylmuramoyl-L-alanine--D-glutamate ligase [Leifsonia xyli]Q6AE62.1 RecName: Full=UDP-N-acetylmuramoylalanine--D-glutamate ligase; AltName: Full=D-glutamic acid-adding enzyme; AltName: Full=UDP-N-acetylmuramoyl-L-alanyl-D-glutamate synthetase [Leifsonia xyli subsp. xyli str. CTCB07]AAT89334.1 UDP-N-acetylmuramoylalanine-D-glutamate ligase [Leifsonia xyli subsp. xyli str. CTCB07]ODA89662.1 UDP-N-acetylmuramoylalanine--D-glutamate ligase [Leifsonia xyli subsp. xyli]